MLKPGRKRSLTYYGGKARLAPWLADLLPWEYESLYAEPFAGGAWVLINRRPVKREILNDANGRLINWFRQVRDNPDFPAKIALTPRSRQEFEWALQNLDREDDPVLRALAFYVVVHQSLLHGDSTATHKTSWGITYEPGKGGGARRAGMRAWQVEWLAERLREVQLESCDALDILEKTARVPNAVIYCDPPYRTADNSLYSVNSVDWDGMADLLLSQQGAVAVSGYGDEWDMLGWDRLEVNVLCTAAARPTGALASQRIEVIWRNAKCVDFTPKQQLLLR